MDEQPKDQKKERSCLKCGEKFLSHSFGERLCWGCNEDNKKYHVKEALDHWPRDNIEPES